MLLRYYRVVLASDIVDRYAPGKVSRRVPSKSILMIVIRMCIRGGAQLLKAAGLPAAMFIATGFVNTDLEHDRMKSL